MVYVTGGLNAFIREDDVVIFGRLADRERDEDEFDDDEEQELVLFQGALSGEDANLAANARLARAGLIPAKEIVSNAMQRRARTLIIEPKGSLAAIRLIIDGVAHPGGTIPDKRGLAVVQMIKLLAGLDVKVRNREQSGGIKAEFRETPYTLYTKTEPARGGQERLVVLIKNQKEQILTPQDAHLTEDMKSKIREICTGGDGLIVICGPPGSGSTTTSIVVLHTIDAFLYSIYSIANTRGRELINVTSFEREPEWDLDSTIQRALRKEAGVLFMDPLTDAESAQTAFKFRSKLAIVCEVKAPTPAAAIQQLIKWVEDPEVVASGLRGVITQKLIRTLCDDCKEAYRPNPKLLKKIGLPPETKVLYRPPNPPDPEEIGAEEAVTVEELCADCEGLPYHGRTGIYEVLEVTSGMRSVIRDGAKPEAIKKQMREEGMLMLQKDGLRIVQSGKTSLEELQRVFAPPKPRPGKRRRR